jgi:hypothetical protein
MDEAQIDIWTGEAARSCSDDATQCLTQASNIVSTLTSICDDSDGLGADTPGTCSHECAVAFLPFMKSCGGQLSGMMAADRIAALQSFALQCKTPSEGAAGGGGRH